MQHDHDHDFHEIASPTIAPNNSIFDSSVSTITSMLLNSLNPTMDPHSMHDHHGMHHEHIDMNNTESIIPSHNHNAHMDHGSSGHAMSFHFGHNQVLFFDTWNINSSITLIYACIGIFLFSVLYEGLKVFREHLMSYPPFARYQASGRKASSAAGRHKKGCCADRLEDHDPSAYAKMNETPSVQTLPQFGMERGFKSCDCRSSPSFSILDHGLQSILHIIQTGLGFMLMLIFMTFNVWLCLALLLGAGFGYFCFAWKRKIAIVDVTQHCN